MSKVILFKKSGFFNEALDELQLVEEILAEKIDL